MPKVRHPESGTRMAFGLWRLGDRGHESVRPVSFQPQNHASRCSRRFGAFVQHTHHARNWVHNSEHESWRRFGEHFARNTSYERVSGFFLRALLVSVGLFLFLAPIRVSCGCGAATAVWELDGSQDDRSAFLGVGS